MSRSTFMASLMGSIGAQHGTEDELLGVWDIPAVPYRKTSADGMASTTTANTQIGFINPYPFSLQLIAAYAVAVGGTLTADNTNYATITLKFDDGAAGTPAVAAQWDTQITGTGNWAVGVKKAATITTANKILVSGGVVWFNIAKPGSGVVVPTSDYYMLFRKLG